jgi:uncharacterized protein YciI
VGLYVLIGRDGPRGAELRKLHREAHLRNLEPLASAERIAYAGPLLDAADQPVGSVIIFEAESLAAARSFAQRDPYVVQGVFERWEVWGSRQVFPSLA